MYKNGFGIKIHFHTNKIVLFQTIQFSLSTQFKISKIVQFQTIQFSISTEFKCQNSSISKKYIFLRKNQTDHVRNFIWSEWKRGKWTIRYQEAPSHNSLRTTIGPLNTNSGPGCKGKKEHPAERFRHSLLEPPKSISNRQVASQEIKVKLNESQLLKYTKLNNWKKIQPENSAEKISLLSTRN